MTGGGVAAAFAASTCCVLPLSLATAGVSGAWIASLSVLAPFQLGLRMLAWASGSFTDALREALMVGHASLFRRNVPQSLPCGSGPC